MNKKVFDYGKWVVIVILCVLVGSLLKTNHTLESNYESWKKDGTYIRAYSSKTIGELKKENAELYAVIKKEKDVKQAVIIKYKYKYNGETIYVDRELPPLQDSIYRFAKTSDTISYNLLVKADKVSWYKLDFNLNEKLTLVNRESNGQNQISISTSNGGGSIIGASVFNKKDNKNNFFNRFNVGFQAGVGYGMFNKTPDVYIGFGVGFRLNKIK